MDIKETLNLSYLYVDSLKWPILVGAAIYYFREEIKIILERGFSMKHGDTEIIFQQKTKNEAIDRQQKEIEKTTEDKTQGEIQKLLGDNKDKDAQIFKFKLEKHFEYTYRIIFRSQISLLLNLQILADGFSPIQINNFFKNVQKTNPVFSSWTPDIYLNFLFSQNLIEKDRTTGKIKITAVGNLFLQYLDISRYDYNSEKNL